MVPANSAATLHHLITATTAAVLLLVLSAQHQCSASANPFMFTLRSTLSNPVTYMHSILVNQLEALPCYYGSDGSRYGSSNHSDMAWYRHTVSTHNPRTFPSISDNRGRLLILEPVIGYNWFLCDTAFKLKLQHAKKYNEFYSQFDMGQLSMDWNHYQEFSEFNRGQFKHHLFSNELSMTEITVFINATLSQISSSNSFDMTEITKPLEMGLFKLTLLGILETECRTNKEQHCESPTIDLLIARFDLDGGITIQGKAKIFLSNERLLKYGPDAFLKNRELAIKRNTVRWTMKNQSIDLGPLSALNRYPLTLFLVVSSSAHVTNDCVGSGSYLSVKYNWECVLCRPGYYLKNEPWMQAASEKNSICHLCPVGTYSSSWGSIECHPCPKSHTTRKVGSTKQTDCLPLSRYAMDDKIKGLLIYFGIRDTDDNKKGLLLAVILLMPCALFLVFLVLSFAYSHNEVRESERRFQLEKELGSIVLKIRRNYNDILDESMQL